MQINKQILEEITRQINSKSFRETELYKVSRDELSGIGNWKAKPRGRPDVKNFGVKQRDEWDKRTTNTRNGQFETRIPI